MSGTPMNLNKARKEKSRAAKKSEAGGNALKFGRTKAEKLAQAKAAAAALKKHDGHKREE